MSSASPCPPRTTSAGLDHQLEHLYRWLDQAETTAELGRADAVREDLARTLRGLLERREAGEIRAFRRIAIETSGLADPAPILYTLGADPMLDHCLSGRGSHDGR